MYISILLHWSNFLNLLGDDFVKLRLISEANSKNPGLHEHPWSLDWACVVRLLDSLKLKCVRSPQMPHLRDFNELLNAKWNAKAGWIKQRPNQCWQVNKYCVYVLQRPRQGGCIGLTGLQCLHITKTCLYSFDHLKPRFYIVKLGFTGVMFS